jgi:hypothetical protein
MSRFHAYCRSFFLLHNRHNRLLGGGGALWRACNLTAFIHSSTGPVVHLFASRLEGPGFNPYEGTYDLCETRILLLVLSRSSVKISAQYFTEEQNRQNRTGGTGQPGRDSQERVVENGQPGKDSPGQDCQDWIARQDSQNRTTRIGPPWCTGQKDPKRKLVYHCMVSNGGL